MLSLVNSSGHHSTAFFEPIPVHDSEVKVELPKEAKSAFSLKLNKETPLSQDSECSCVKVERLE